MAAERWETYSEEFETLAEQMGRWVGEMATMSEGAPGYASLAQYEAYVAGMRATETSSPAPEAGGQNTQKGRGNAMLTGAGLVQGIASRLGLIRR